MSDILLLPEKVAAARADRRRLLTLTWAAAALAFTAPVASGSTARASERRFSGDPFTLGVASGDPLPDSVVLWTRLALAPFEPDGGMGDRAYPVQWQVAADERFRHVVRSGTAIALPAEAHSVHVDVRGLKPGRTYYYRFRAGGVTSPVGRTRTAPALGARVRSFALAFASCQSWPGGYYTAYRHLAGEDLDLVIHLGDYLYEGGIDAQGGLRGVPVPDQFRSEATTLERYRLQYALYKSDPDLQAAHAAFPWVVTWDDHEVENNYAGAISENNDDPAAFLLRRAQAYRAYWEHLPLRPLRRPVGPDMPLYRRFTYGDILQLNVLDSRQYRSDQACGDGWDVGCDERLDPSRTLLGMRQERWLLGGLARSRARWNVIAQQVVMAQRDRLAGPEQEFSMDAWDGYKAARDRILGGIAERGVPNPVVITGDVHVHYAFDLKRDFDDPDSETIGVELVGTSISSGGNGADEPGNAATLYQENPHLKFTSARRGYVRCRLARDHLRADYRVVPYVDRPGAPVATQRSFAVEAGNPGLQPA